MGLVVWEGILIAVLVLTGFRTAVFKAVPKTLRTAISVGIGLGLLSRGHRGGGGQDNHRGEQERQEGDDDGKTGDGGETTHRNLRYIWRATRKRITDHRWYRVG